MSTKTKLRPLQSKFKIEARGQESGCITPSKPFGARKAHNKSRGGCQTCKKRRVKCDEGKPVCGRCGKLGADCLYDSANVSTQVITLSEEDGVGTTMKAPSSGMYSMAIDLIETDIGRLLYSNGNSRHTNPSNARMLHYFQTATATTIGCHATKNAMQSYVGGVAWGAPYLMHMVLAISYAHRRHLGTPSSTVAEAEHWSHSLRCQQQNFAKLLLGDIQCCPDEVIATTILTIMYTYCLEDDIPEDALSSTDSAFENFLAPFSANAGFRSLSHLFPPDRRDCPAFMGVLYNSDDARRTFSSEKPGREGLPRAFVELCEITEESTSENDPYHKIVRHITPILHLEPHPDSFAILMAFLGRTWPCFRPLVACRDPRTLLLLSYWLALLRQIDQWWLIKRARTACKAIVSYLYQMGDLQVRSLLEFPAAFGKCDMLSMWEYLLPVVNDIIQDAT